MVTSAADTVTLPRVDKTPVERVQWCPGCNRTRTLDHFTPLDRGIPDYRPYCHDCTPFTPQRRVGWFHSFIKTIRTAFCHLADRVQTDSNPNKLWYGAKSTKSRTAWSANPATDAIEFVRLGDGLLIDMSSPDARRLLVCLQSCEGILKQHREETPDQQKEKRYRRSGQTGSGSLESDASVQAVLEPRQQNKVQETYCWQCVE